MEKHRIDEWRKLANKSQEDMAKCLNISVSAYRMKEAGTNDWKAHEVNMMLKLFGIIWEQVEF